MMRGWIRIMLAMALPGLVVVQPLDAQRQGGTTRGAAPRGTAAGRADATAVRAELAAVLLQSRRYDEAAREYRVLVAREPRNVAYRLGLARALAWGRRPREAERELRAVRAFRPNDREIESLLRSVRESLQPNSREAASWVAERPAHTPYRLALARALVREGRPGAALEHYDRLIAGDRSTTLQREAASANRAAGQYVREAILLIGVLQRSPRDTAVRHALASALWNARRLDAAIAHYDTLIAWNPTPEVLLERAQLNVKRRDLVAAEADVNASNLARPNAGAYRLLGDLRRWRGEVAEARTAYNLARVLAPEDDAAAEAIAQLEREERPVAALTPLSHDAVGWQFHSSAVADNAGMVYATAGARGDVQLLPGVAGSVDLGLRRFHQDTTGLNADITSFAIGLGLSGGVARGPVLVQVGARGGLTHDVEKSIFTGGIGTTGWSGAWGLGLELTTGPAYPSLLTAGSIRPPRDEILTERIARAAIGGPLGHADVALSVERAGISDGNRRSSVHASVRHPLAPATAVIASANGIWFAERTALYWDPIAYTAAMGGVEYAVRQPRGFSFAARVLAGPAQVDDEILRNRRPEIVRRHSLQLGGGIEVGYTSVSRTLGAAVTYGSGRTGEYRRLEANVHARLLR